MLFVTIAGSILFFLLAIVIISLPFFFIFIRPAIRERKLLKTGKDGVGIIKDVRESGYTKGRRIQVYLIVRVQPADGSSVFETQATVWDSRINPVLKEGIQVTVKYDPDKKTTIFPDLPNFWTSLGWIRKNGKTGANMTR
jgi:hypothetical protein